MKTQFSCKKTRTSYLIVSPPLQETILIVEENNDKLALDLGIDASA